VISYEKDSQDALDLSNCGTIFLFLVGARKIAPSYGVFFRSRLAAAAASPCLSPEPQRTCAAVVCHPATIK